MSVNEKAPSATRGGYTKGRATRQQILQAALDLYGTTGSKRPTLKAIAARCGMAEAGVMHHFATLEHLFVAVLDMRDEQAASTYELVTPEQVWSYLSSTTRTPGLTRLFIEMSAAAGDPSHPAHDFMGRHRARAAEAVRSAFNIEDDQTIRCLIATAEGLQMQWLTQPNLDISDDLRQHLCHLRPE